MKKALFILRLFSFLILILTSTVPCSQAAEPAKQLDSTDAEKYLNDGKHYLDSKYYDGAISKFNKALEINPRLAKAYINRGIAYGYKNEYEKAICDLNRALEIGSLNAEIYLFWGIIYTNKGEYEKAFYNYYKALQIEPRHAEVYINRGNAYNKWGKYEKAITDFDKAIGIDPAYVEAFLNKAIAYENMGKKKEAIKIYESLIECANKRKDIKGPFYSQVAYIRMKILEGHSFKRTPLDVRACYNMAIALESSGNKEEAINAYRRIIEYAPPEYAPYIEDAKRRIKELKRK